MNISNQVELRYCTIEDIAALLPLMEQFGRPATYDVLSTRFQSFIANFGYSPSFARNKINIVNDL